MCLNKERAFEVLNKISFERIAGTDKELECANILKEEIEKYGIEVEIQDFEIDMPEVQEVRFMTTKPFEEEYTCIGIGKSGYTDDEGIRGPICYIENGMDANLLDVKGKIVLLTGGGPDLTEKLIKKGAIGYIGIHGSLYDPEEMVTEIRTRNAFKKPGDESNFPGVVLHIKDAQKLLRSNPEEVKIVLKQDAAKKGTSHNVIATIPGTKYPDEIITFSAHYDSVIYSSGAWDNGTGSITIMELMHYFNENKPDRTLKFIWCGSEEIGLLGSKAFCQKYEKELDKILFNVNVDMTGTLLGYDIAVCTCEDSVSKFINYLGKIEGFAINSKVDVYSSDSTAFAANGVPAVTFARIAPRGGAEIHSRRDVIDHLDPQKFINTVEFMAKFSEKFVNAKVFPVDRVIPKELSEKLERFKKMMGEKKKEEAPKENKEEAKDK